MAKSKPIELLTTREVRGMLNHGGRGKTALRNRALIVLMWRGGLRVAEAVAVEPRDVNWDTGQVRIRRGKGHKARTVRLDPEALDVVVRWSEYRDRVIMYFRWLRPDGPPLCCTLDGGKVSPRYVQAMLRRLAKRAGIEKRVHPHALRHLCAVELSRERTPLHVIQAALGHAHATTTSHYINHCEAPEVMAAMGDRVSWQAAPALGRQLRYSREPAATSERMTGYQSLMAGLPRTQLPLDD